MLKEKNRCRSLDHTSAEIQIILHRPETGPAPEIALHIDRTLALFHLL